MGSFKKVIILKSLAITKLLYYTLHVLHSWHCSCSCLCRTLSTHHDIKAYIQQCLCILKHLVLFGVSILWGRKRSFISSITCVMRRHCLMWFLHSYVNLVDLTLMGTLTTLGVTLMCYRCNIIDGNTQFINWIDCIH